MATKPRKLKNLLEFKDREQVRDLLLLASGKDSRDEIDKILMGYIMNKKWALYGFFDGPVLHALIGLELGEKKTASIQYIAVRPDSRRQGYGHDLIDLSIKKNKLKELYAETDSEAKEFYEKFGFQLQKTVADEHDRKKYLYLFSD